MILVILLLMRMFCISIVFSASSLVNAPYHLSNIVWLMVSTVVLLIAVGLGTKPPGSATPHYWLKLGLQRFSGVQINLKLGKKIVTVISEVQGN